MKPDPCAAPRPTHPRTLVVLGSLPQRGLLLLIRLYQRSFSPLLPVVSLGACGCRFSPTCSHYALEAVRTHGALAGARLTIVRLLKCTPLHPGGLDPVPPLSRSARLVPPVCRAVKLG